MKETTTHSPVAMTFRTLASGSSGNATYLRVGSTCILIDAGISLRRIRNALKEMGESIEELSALIITHEHSDHIKGCASLLKARPDLPIFATFGTKEACCEKASWASAAQIIEAQRAFAIDEVEVLPFRTSHDARESVGLRFEARGAAFGFATDLGRPTAEVIDCLQGCQALVLEANYDEELLLHSPYPVFLKRRIAGRGGHLSNVQARQLLKDVADEHLETVVLGHLSDKNNTPQRAVATVAEALHHPDDITLVAAARLKPGPLFELRSPKSAAPLPRQAELPI